MNRGEERRGEERKRKVVLKQMTSTYPRYLPYVTLVPYMHTLIDNGQMTS